MSGLTARNDRVEDLLNSLSARSKIGLMFHPGVPVLFVDGAPDFTRIDLLIKTGIRHVNIVGDLPDVGAMCQWHNAVQKKALADNGIPMTFSSDPRHASTDNPGTGAKSGPFSRWPEAIGIAALDDVEIAQAYGETVRAEYTAVGIRVALHPQIDLATEPRWARTMGTFGEDAELTIRTALAYVRGLMGADPRTGVSPMIKHFPGAGPRTGGRDPHFADGADQNYPAGLFDLHLSPFRALVHAGVRQVMPAYGLPRGTALPEVAFGFNRPLIEGVLREELGFDGIVCTDWGLLTDDVIRGELLPARAWGLEDASVEDRALAALDAGVDQFGGEECVEVLQGLLRSGALDVDRLNRSARRLLREKAVLGLFEAPYVDVQAAREIVGSPTFRAQGTAAQQESIVQVSVGPTPLPGSDRVRKIYAEGFAPESLTQHGRVVASVEEADIAILRLTAPWDSAEGGFSSAFHNGSLEFSPEEVERIVGICASVPTALAIYLERAAVLTPFLDKAAVFADFGSSRAAILDVVLGVHRATGRLPFDLPRSDADVVASREDAPFDLAEPLVRFGTRAL